jgi:hypothetical protein
MMGTFNANQDKEKTGQKDNGAANQPKEKTGQEEVKQPVKEPVTDASRKVNEDQKTNKNAQQENQHGNSRTV